MNNIFQYRETRDVVYDTYKRVEEMSAVLSKLGLFRGQFAGGVAITQGNRIFFQNTSGHGHWSIFASEGEEYWKFHDVLRGADLLVFESGDTIRVFPDTTPSTITIEDVFALAAGTALETWYVGDEEWYLGADEGAYFEFYSHNHATYPDELDLFTKELRITKYTFGTSPAVGPLKISGVTGTGDATNEVQIIANCGAEFIFGKTAPTHTKGGAAILWNKANTNMLFANNDAEVMRLTSGGNLCLGITNTPGRVDIATNDGSGNYTRMTMFQARVTTSDATPTTLWSYTPAPGRTAMLEARVVARRTAGGGGAAGDGAGYVIRAAYGISTGPTTTLFGTVDQWAREAVAGYDATFVIDGSNNIVLQVTGVAGTFISWQASIYLDIIGG